jgi:hypothetical protein
VKHGVDDDEVLEFLAGFAIKIKSGSRLLGK